MRKIDFTDDYKKLSSEVLNFVKDIYGDKSFTFKVKTRRVNKNFPMHSDEISAELGGDILERFVNT
ncbi:MAG: tRNA 4-thiouridine(8) synthase ThiI, partial [Lachnospiraceae bacterium]|nr:tRNA 4-thiouridine(8) synthase ThiI [Lachnospiraceae bacterium]